MLKPVKWDKQQGARDIDEKIAGKNGSNDSYGFSAKANNYFCCSATPKLNGRVTIRFLVLYDVQGILE